MKSNHLTLAALTVLLVAGCASVPNAPSRMALPGTGKSFEQFRFDDANCQNYAFEQVGGRSAEKAANQATARSAAIGTAVGAVAGAAIGGKSGAGVGAGAGLIVGTAAGSESGQRAAIGTQRQYDNAYVQCMYGRGHKVPVSAEMARSLQQTPMAPSAPPPPTAHDRTVPPPPAGNPPPPPPGY